MKFIYLFCNNSIYILMFFLVLVSCSDKKQRNGLIIKDNIIYKIGDDKPFTGTERGWVEDRIIEYDIVDGIKHGRFLVYFEDETVAIKGQIDSNRNVGRWQYFYRTGAIESEGEFVNDLPDGRWCWYYPSGDLKEEGEYRMGQKVGAWKTYSDVGELVSEEELPEIVAE